MGVDRGALPADIEQAIEDTGFVLDTVGMSGNEIRLFPERVLKIREDDAEARDEHCMLRWLEGRLPVPQVLAHAQVDRTHYLLMTRLRGRMACDDVYMKDPARLAALLAEALRRLWRVDVTGCPVDQRLERKLKAAAHRVERGLVDMADAEPGTYGAGSFRSPEALLHWLADNRPPEEPVLSHGDFCLPNLLFDGDVLAGYVDLGRAGIADRWQDIALCYRSLLHNYDGTYSGVPHAGWRPELLFEELGLRPDWARIRYYMLLDELF